MAGRGEILLTRFPLEAASSLMGFRVKVLGFRVKGVGFRV